MGVNFLWTRTSRSGAMAVMQDISERKLGARAHMLLREAQLQRRETGFRTYVSTTGAIAFKSHLNKCFFVLVYGLTGHSFRCFKVQGVVPVLKQVPALIAAIIGVSMG